MIVMKFGGTSVGEGSRIVTVVEIVREALPRRPVVVVSALAGVTDLLLKAVDAARYDDLEALDPILADLERRHRWAIGDAVRDPRRRHDLSLEVQRLFEELRQLLRAVRVLGEGTPSSSDAVLAFGEDLSGRILTEALNDHDVRARWIDSRSVIRTDGSHGRAEPDLTAVAGAAGALLGPLVRDGEVPVVGGFVGSAPTGRTTTLGRGGSDTTAAVLACALAAEEVQIWTDVDGILTADPRLVDGARTLPRVTFAEAAELALYGARVLHPASVAPAVRRQIPVTVRNTLRPSHSGTSIVPSDASDGPDLVSVASRSPVTCLRVESRRLRPDPDFPLRALSAMRAVGMEADLALVSPLSVTGIVGGEVAPDALQDSLEKEAVVGSTPDRALVAVVGSGLARSSGVRRRVLAELSELDPEILAAGRPGASLAAVFPGNRLAECVRALHERFLEDRVET